jgi:hypothetical protein
MITEDYVSFETAKLLKEKGFPQDPHMCNTAYTLKGKFSNNAKSFCHNVELFKQCEVKPLSYSIAPTIQMTLKWLREEKNLFIGIEPRLSQTDYSYITAYIYRTKKKHSYYHEDDIIEYDSCAQCDGDSFENACERAIKYCLENLIK